MTHVLIDCTALPANRGGVGRYIEGLLGGFDPEAIELTIAVQHRDAADLAAIVPWARVHALPERLSHRALRLVWEQLGLPGVARAVGADVIHSPHYTFPVLTRRRRVVTLHDATFFSDPEVHGTLKRAFFRWWTARAWRHADAVVMPSAATHDEIARFLGAPRAHPVIALHGVDREVFHQPTPADVSLLRAELGLAAHETWIAFLGTIEPRKNLTALFDAYAVVRQRLGAAAPTLLLAGGRGWDAPVFARLDADGGIDGVRELGYLRLEQLPALLGGAEIVAYPSLGEGFGLPVLEAMSAGAAVLTTRRLALPEVGGDAVEYSEPDAPALTAAMLALLSDPARRAELGASALARAATLSWSASAAAHLEAYTERGARE